MQSSFAINETTSHLEASLGRDLAPGIRHRRFRLLSANLVPGVVGRHGLLLRLELVHLHDLLILVLGGGVFGGAGPLRRAHVVPHEDPGHLLGQGAGGLQALALHKVVLG